MAQLHRLFEQMNALSASDLHLAAGRPPAFRIHGEVMDVAGFPSADDAALRAQMRELASPVQWNAYLSRRDLDFAIGVPGVGRFRANYFVLHGGAAAVFRRIPESITPLDKLGMPTIVDRIADARSGMVLVTGPTGSGKSTTLAAMIDRINQTVARHIVTVEDPVEFVHKNKLSIVTQREVGTDALSFASGVQGAVGADADVVLVGELRDLETIETALDASLMGILIFGTLHTSSAAKTIDRIIDVFPAERQDQVRNALAESLTAVISQILVRRADGSGRVAALEVLVRTPAVAAAIRDGHVTMIDSIIGAGRRFGMRAMDDDLLALYETRVISGADLFLKARNKQRFERLAET